MADATSNYCGYGVSTAANTTTYVPFIWTLPGPQTATTSGTTTNIPNTSTTGAVVITQYGCFFPSRDGSALRFCGTGGTHAYGTGPGSTLIYMMIPTESVNTTYDNFSTVLGGFNSALTVKSTASL